MRDFIVSTTLLSDINKNCPIQHGFPGIQTCILPGSIRPCKEDPHHLIPYPRTQPPVGNRPDHPHDSRGLTFFRQSIIINMHSKESWYGLAPELSLVNPAEDSRHNSTKCCCFPPLCLWGIVAVFVLSNLMPPDVKIRRVCRLRFGALSLCVRLRWTYIR